MIQTSLHFMTVFCSLWLFYSTSESLTIAVIQQLHPSHHTLTCKLNGLVQDWHNWHFQVNFFTFKVPEFLHVLFNLVVKHSPVFFWLACTLFLRKARTKYWSVHSERNEAEQEEIFCFAFLLWLVCFKKFRQK